MMPRSQSAKARNLARVFLVLAIASTIGCARSDWIDRTLVTEDVTGVWSASTIQLELQQQGARVTGVITVPPFGGSSLTSGVPLEGSVAGDVFSFKDSRGVYSGELTVSGDDMTGQIFGPYGKRKASFRRESAASQPDSPRR